MAQSTSFAGDRDDLRESVVWEKCDVNSWQVYATPLLFETMRHVRLTVAPDFSTIPLQLRE